MSQAEAAVELIWLLEGGTVKTVRILCLYSPQRDIIKDMVDASYHGSLYVIVSTVDGAQGSEADAIILVSTATSVPNFTGDRRRILVAATRARQQLVVLGMRSILAQSAMWSVFLSTLRPGEYTEWDHATKTLKNTPATAPINAHDIQVNRLS